MLRISVFASIYPPPYFGGAESTLRDIVEDNARRGAILNIHSLRADNNPVLDVNKSNINVFYHKHFNIYNPFKLRRRHSLLKLLWHSIEIFNFINYFRSLKILKNEEPDIVIFHNLTGWSYFPILAAKTLSIPICYYSHDYGLICRNRGFRNKRLAKNCADQCTSCKFYTFPFRILLSKSLLVFNSHFTKRKILKYWPKAKSNNIFTLHPPINLDEIDFEIPVKPSDKVVGMIGRITPEKGMDKVLEICKNLDVNCIVAGVGDHNYLTVLKRINPNAQFVGYLQRKQFFKIVDIVAVPSIWEEPYGKVATEALLAGKKLLISNLGGLNESAGLVGLPYSVFSPNSTEEITKALETLLESNVTLNVTDHRIMLNNFQMRQDEELELYFREIKSFSSNSNLGQT